MNINVAFGTENASRSPARNLGKKADVEEGDWEITVAATVTGGYKDSVYTLNLAVGDEYPLQNITLIKPPRVYETFTDERDGTIYKKVEIGEQTWMAENLNYNASGSTCFNNNADSCAKYGRLYNWKAAMGKEPSYPDIGGSSAVPSGVQGVCPADWHLPSDAEWTMLTDYVGGTSYAGTKLKSSTGWSSSSGAPAGTDDFGFSALPGSYGNSEGSFGYRGYYGRWWSATAMSDVKFARHREMDFNYERVYSTNSEKKMEYSVRCVQDEE
jgi:uncharacterized protein (TIGR02145 family)